MKFIFGILIPCFLISVNANAKEYRPRPRDSYVFDLIKPNSVGIEIGVWNGTFACHVLSKTQPEHLYLVDPWKWPPQDAPKYGEATPEKEQHIEDLYMNVCNHFQDRTDVSILRMTSLEASDLFPDEFFDFIYVDGDHSYEGVMTDLTYYLPKLKQDGVLIGDDFGFDSVKSAVGDFLNRNKHLYRLIETKYGQYLIKKI